LVLAAPVQAPLLQQLPLMRELPKHGQGMAKTPVNKADQKAKRKLWVSNPKRASTLRQARLERLQFVQERYGKPHD